MNRLSITPLWKILLGAFLMVDSMFVQAATSDSPIGRWVTQSRNLEVEILPCGKAVCGFVTTVFSNKAMSPNADNGESKTAKDIRGLKILRDFVLTSSVEDGAQVNEWSGEIYDRENEKTYKCLMTLERTKNGRVELVLRAYIGFPIFGKTQRWTRSISTSTATNEH